MACDPRLFLIGAYAEQYVYLDPNASMVRSRQFGEKLAEVVWSEFGLDGTSGTQHERVRVLHTQEVIDDSVYQLFTDVRRIGNKAVHDQWDDKADALRLLQACHELGSWFQRVTEGGSPPPPFNPPALVETRRPVNEHDAWREPAGWCRVPRQLPPRRPTFAGRRAALERLDGLLGAAPRPGMAVITAIAGMAGIGKTALALHWAHEAERHFPDGQLYVDLRGFDPGEPVAVAQVLHEFLQALGVPPASIPSRPEARTALYRGLVAGRHMLIVLDNARSVQQVTPLLPNAPTCTVVVTSRNRLNGLVVRYGADRIVLDPMSTVDAVELLAQRLGRARVDAEPEATDDLAAACAHLPLALSIAAAGHPDLPLRGLVERLRNHHDRLDALDLGEHDLNVRAVFSWSYHQLSDEAARLFRRLGVHPGPDFDACVCAALLDDVRLGDARAALTELTSANLVDEHRPGRFRLHDLLRIYAEELAVGAERRGAEFRMIRYYFYASGTVNSRIQPCWDEHVHESATADNYPAVRNYADAMTWFGEEQATLRSVIELAGRRGDSILVEELARGCATFLARTGQRRERVALRQAALTATRHGGYRPAIIASLRELARALMRSGQFVEATSCLDEAFDLVQLGGNDNDAIAIHLNYSLLFNLKDQHTDALRHAQAAEQITRHSADLRYEAGVLTAVARQLACLGENAAALHLCEEGRDLYVQVRNRGGEAQALSILGLIHQNLGHEDEAIVCYEQALELDRRIDSRYWEAVVLERLSDLHEAGGHPDPARNARQQALAILTSLDRG